MKKTGFTIVELLLYMGLLTIMTVILTRLFTSILDVQTSSVATSAVEQDSRYLYMRFSYDIGRAASIAAPATLGVAADSLTLTVGTIANTYGVVGDNLELSNEQGTNTLNSVSTHITNLSVTQLGKANGKNALRVGFTITSAVESISGPETKNVQMTIALR